MIYYESAQCRAAIYEDKLMSNKSVTTGGGNRYVERTHDDGSSTTNTVDSSGTMTNIRETDPDGDSTDYNVSHGWFGPGKGSSKS